ncbi:uncharacterized protein G2W53_039555 [Senna tora]|uniref:Uncharacterized protein n=1 Tax=Senna tora TaxID=362788 RepID=A0A834W819_9FABA|nr:uncharacterized protein G2W53_039555 [Senna tora]
MPNMMTRLETVTNVGEWML